MISCGLICQNFIQNFWKPKSKGQGYFLTITIKTKTAQQKVEDRKEKEMNKHTEETLTLLAMLEEENPAVFECLADDLMDDEDFENPYEEAYNEFFEKVKDL